MRVWWRSWSEVDLQKPSSGFCRPQELLHAQNNSGKECGDGSRLLHLAACGLLLWFSQISIGRTLTRVVDTVLPGSAGRGRHS